jgi:predicted cation transporter
MTLLHCWYAVLVVVVILQVLIANAWHHRTDAVSSVVALIAIVGARAGLPILDPLAGLLVAGMVSLTGLQVQHYFQCLFVHVYIYSVYCAMCWHSYAVTNWLVFCQCMVD